MSASFLKIEILMDGVAPKAGASAASKHARKFRCRGGRKPPKKAAGQARAIVNDDAPTSRAGAI
jgi:hypothetical protein